MSCLLNSTSLCSECQSFGYCRKIRTRIVSADELKNHEYVRDVRATAYRQGVTFRRWRPYVVDKVWEYPGWFAGWDGKPTELDLDVFERPNIEYWFRDFCCKACPPNTKSHVRVEAVPRVIVLATILKALYPNEARLWGVRPANDNMRADNDNKRQD